MPASMHLQFLRGGEAAQPVEYAIVRVFDGRTTATRRVDARQDGRLLTTATVSFAADLLGPEHGHRAEMPGDPTALARTGPAGPAPSMPLDELDIRIADEGSGEEFVRPRCGCTGIRCRRALTEAERRIRRCGFTVWCGRISGICWSPGRRRPRAGAVLSPPA
jgi:Thioesterase-like superfamily